MAQVVVITGAGRGIGAATALAAARAGHAVGEPAEIAAAILWLLSDAASYTTGSVLTVAGGL